MLLKINNSKIINKSNFSSKNVSFNKILFIDIISKFNFDVLLFQQYPVIPTILVIKTSKVIIRTK